MTSDTNQRTAPILLAGCAPDSGNLGVVALAYSLALGLSERLPGQRMEMIGFGGNRLHSIDERGATHVFPVLGLNHSRRLYSPNASTNLDLSFKLGIPWSKLAKTIRATNSLLDISAGDSFSDIYGQHRYDAVCYLKELMLQLGKPVVFLPQTYGPFREHAARERASRLVRQALSCWARDADSFDVLKELLGSDFDPSRHRQGVDVAFLLPIREPEKAVVDAFQAKRESSTKWIGFNVSGLVHNDPEKSKDEFQLKCDYREAVHRIVQELAKSEDHSVMLVSHVFGGPSRDSDPPACEAVRNGLPPEMRQRVSIAPAFTDPRQIKWLISQCDWFCGTRMHATIAGLSSGTATASIAYSMKTRGVFESCGVADQVIDPRHLDTDEVVRQTIQSFHDRETTRQRIAKALPATLEIARQQMDDIAALCKQA